MPARERGRRGDEVHEARTPAAPGTLQHLGQEGEADGAPASSSQRVRGRSIARTIA